MKRKQLCSGRGFRVAIGTERSQAAEMVIEPGKSEGGPHNRYRDADQWLYVLSGTGRAKINGRSRPLSAGTLLLIEHKDEHEIKNTGRTPLKTLNVYVPPAYSKNGNELPQACRPAHFGSFGSSPQTAGGFPSLDAPCPSS